MEVHVRNNQAMVTLVGQALKRCTVASRLSAFVTRMAAVILPQDSQSRSVHIVVAQEHLRACLDALEAAFFSDVDPSAFALPEPAREPQPQRTQKISSSPEQQRFAPAGNRLALGGTK